MRLRWILGGLVGLFALTLLLTLGANLFSGAQDGAPSGNVFQSMLENPLLATLFAGLIILFITFAVQFVVESTRGEINKLEKRLDEVNQTVGSMVDDKFSQFNTSASRIENKIDALYAQPFFRELGEYDGVFDFSTAAGILKSAIFLIEKGDEASAHEWVYTAVERLRTPSGGPGPGRDTPLMGTPDEFALLAEFTADVLHDVGLALLLVQSTKLAPQSGRADVSRRSGSRLEVQMTYMLRRDHLISAHELAGVLERELFASALVRFLRRRRLQRYEDLRYSVDAYRALAVYYEATQAEDSVKRLVKVSERYLLPDDAAALKFLIRAMALGGARGAAKRDEVDDEADVRRRLHRMRGADVRRYFVNAVMNAKGELACFIRDTVLQRRLGTFDARINRIWFERHADDLLADAGLLPCEPEPETPPADPAPAAPVDAADPASDEARPASEAADPASDAADPASEAPETADATADTTAHATGSEDGEADKPETEGDAPPAPEEPDDERP
ncbi:MAG: hypothetical protein ACFE0P_08790 [Oceanicaulis sp.]